MFLTQLKKQSEWYPKKGDQQERSSQWPAAYPGELPWMRQSTSCIPDRNSDVGQPHFSWLWTGESCLILPVPWYHTYQMPSGLIWLSITLESYIIWWTQKKLGQFEAMGIKLAPSFVYNPFGSSVKVVTSSESALAPGQHQISWPVQLSSRPRTAVTQITNCFSKYLST